MKKYITKLSNHCYYGNIVNILNYFGVQINEAEFVLLSEILNCEYTEGVDYPLLGFSNDNALIGLVKLGFNIKDIISENELFETLSEGYPVLLCLNSNLLNYSYVFNGTNRKHYIVLLSGDRRSMLISDSYIQTIPRSVFEDIIDFEPIYNSFIEKNIKATSVIPMKIKSINSINYEKYMDDYILTNISQMSNSIINHIKIFSENIIDRAEKILLDSHLNDMVYNFKFSGGLVRFDFLDKLFKSYYELPSGIIESLFKLKTQWNIVINKWMKCCVIKNKDYYKKIFDKEIIVLLEQELSLYQKIAVYRGLL